MVVSHSLRNSARRSTTYFLASSKLANTRLPLIRLHGLQAVTKFSGSFFPLRARGSMKSTDMINEFSKLVRPSNPHCVRSALPLTSSDEASGSSGARR
jgi:hypothetical protein